MRSSARTTISALALCSILGTRVHAQGQTPAAKPDSSPHFALFGGPVGYSQYTRDTGIELGGSGDLRWGPIPVPLRLSVTFTDVNDRNAYGTLKQGTASLELVVRPLPRRLGIQPYLLGGLGMSTMAGYRGSLWQYSVGPDGVVYARYRLFEQPRQSWAFATAGVGVDVGRAFVQVKLAHPIASNGPTTTPVSVGVRFWE
jgi:hypothetical protein